jgi:hypothetical protein
MLAITSGAYTLYGLRVAGPGSVPFPAAIGSLGEELAPAPAELIGTYLILLFPNGRLPPIAWKTDSRKFAWSRSYAKRSSYVQSGELCGTMYIRNR